MLPINSAKQRHFRAHIRFISLLHLILWVLIHFWQNLLESAAQCERKRRTKRMRNHDPTEYMPHFTFTSQKSIIKLIVWRIFVFTSVYFSYVRRSTSTHRAQSIDRESEICYGCFCWRFPFPRRLLFLSLLRLRLLHKSAAILSQRYKSSHNSQSINSDF